MKILYDATNLRFGLNASCARSGIFVVAGELLAELCRREGVEVDAYADPDAVGELRRYFNSRPEFRSLKIVNEVVGVPGGRFRYWLQSHPVPPPQHRGGKLKRTAWIAYRVFRELALLVLDVWFCRAERRTRRGLVDRIASEYSVFFSPMYRAPDVVRLARLPRFTVIYDTIPQVFPEIYGNNPGVVWTQELIDSLNGKDRCFAISEATKRDFLKFAGGLREENVTVIPLAASDRFAPCVECKRIEAVRAKYGIPAGKRYFLSLCTLEPRKNLPFTIRAFAKFAKSHEDVLFVLAGCLWDGYSAQMEEVLAEVGEVRERILRPGYIADEDQAALYSGALAFVYMSIYEGFGLPPLEAMQCGTPVIASDTSSLPEVTGDAGLSISPKHLDGLVDAMTRLADDASLHADLRGRGLERCKRFSWSRAVDIILADMARTAQPRVQKPKSRLLYDGTILRDGLNENAGRSGVYVASYEILRALQNREDLCVDLYARPEHVPEIRRYLGQHPELADVAIAEASLQDYCPAGATALALERYAQPKQLAFAGGCVRLIWLTYLMVRWPLIRFARCLHRLELRGEGVFDGYDAYLSPVYIAPENIVASGLRRHYVLYDTIPMLFPQFYSHATEEMWTSVLARKLTADDRCFAISDCTKRDFLKFAPNLKPENVEVIPLAASERFTPCADRDRIEGTLRKYRLPTDRKYFLSLCTIEPRKNLAFALRAFAEFAKEDEETVFILAGGGWDAYSAKWKSVLKTVDGIRDRIFLPGYVADEDLAPLYSGARAFVYLSVYEGFGLPPLEAMQCGTPVLSSDSSSLPEVVGDAALTVAPTDLDGAVEAMRRLAADDGLCAVLREKGMARAKLFSWDRAAEIIARTLQKGKGTEGSVQ